MRKYIIEARELVYQYPDGTNALNGLTMQIKEGQKVAVLGANGAGKSTLFLHFNGILRPRQGQILFDGRSMDYRHRSLVELRKNVAIVFQDPDHQLFSASVLQDVAFGPLNLGLDKNVALAKAREAMRQTEIDTLSSKPTHFLSYGQKKRVSIAGVLAMEPRVIIFDEPTACLDPRMVDKTMDLLHRLNKQGKTLVMSTHDVDLAYSWADYIYFINGGQVAGEGTPREVFLNRELLAGCGLKQPWVLEVYRELIDSGLLATTAPMPDSKETLLELIRNASPGAAGVKIRVAQ
ncbi:energy-coupling factor ABC transporter ATP-binding protein [Desulfoscipio gibsoniae]|uniref:ABC transporter ATP-binding protein n=1 Tax=Desulfoscipio gibsoniae DSM 7213 TaxID=767817 RepID=R4KQ81_9FIRM|nr:ATP-binding cassette domain-containing protein [Desulfoscipio gibsoniae]AGL01801.1 cobalt transport protein ATP-binding subunit [Desulfoscipio gibsoniae DSM 7213]